MWVCVCMCVCARVCARTCACGSVVSTMHMDKKAMHAACCLPIQNVCVSVR